MLFIVKILAYKRNFDMEKRRERAKQLPKCKKTLEEADGESSDPLSTVLVKTVIIMHNHSLLTTLATLRNLFNEERRERNRKQRKCKNH